MKKVKEVMHKRILLILLFHELGNWENLRTSQRRL